jgi:uncharacterized membrane protein
MIDGYELIAAVICTLALIYTPFFTKQGYTIKLTIYDYIIALLSGGLILADMPAVGLLILFVQIFRLCRRKGSWSD